MYERKIQLRIIWSITVVFFLIFFGLGYKLAYLHLADHSKLPSRSYNASSQAMRGSIYDRNGRQYPMAVSLPARRVFLDPKTVNTNHNVRHIAQTVAGLLDLSEDDVWDKLQRTDAQYIPLKVSLDDHALEALTTNTISGVHFEEAIVRRYPQGRRMAHVLGFVNNMGVGGAGIEQQYNRYLTGTPGYTKGKKSGGKRPKELPDKREADVPPIHGSDIFLTLDHNIQAAVEQAVQEVVGKYEALSGWAIVQHVKTGAILAMASYPDFEPEHYTKSTKDVWRNNALAIVYEPGSIMKAVTAAAGMNEKLATPDSVMDVGEGTWFYAGKILRDHVRGRITLREAIKKSSNVYFAKLGIMLGNKRMEGYLRAFNFGATLGIDLPGEERGLLARGVEWDRDKLKIARVPIGQGIAVTGLQMVNAYSTLANDGVMMKPYVVDKIVSPCGETVFKATPEVLGRPVSQKVARDLREMLRAVTETGGTGTRAAVTGFSVGGKTGTAQKAVPGGYSNTDYYASFVGFVPTKEPVFCVLISVERPGPQHTGGFVAAPVFAQIAVAAARYLEVEPDLSPEENKGFFR